MPYRLACFVSHIHGDVLLRALLGIGHLARVVLIATDDPQSPYSNARLRLWRYWTDRERDELARLVPDLARELGLTAFTGRIRPPNGEFRRLFDEARPDALVASVFGQRLPQHLLDAVGDRAWNLHPVVPGQPLAVTSGPRPIETALERGDRAIQMALHRMSAEYDDGPELGRSEPFPLPITGVLDAGEMLRIVKGTAPLGAGLVTTHLARLRE